MSVGEQHSTCRQTIEIGCPSLWVAAETADPVVQVIQGNEKNIRLVGGSGGSNHRNDERQEQNSQPVCHFFTLPLRPRPGSS